MGSMSIFGNYSFAMYMFSVYGLITAVLFLIFPSPQQTELVQDMEDIIDLVIETRKRAGATSMDAMETTIPSFDRPLSTGPSILRQITPFNVDNFEDMNAIRNELNELTTANRSRTATLAVQSHPSVQRELSVLREQTMSKDPDGQIVTSLFNELSRMSVIDEHKTTEKEEEINEIPRIFVIIA